MHGLQHARNTAQTRGAGADTGEPWLHASQCTEHEASQQCLHSICARCNAVLMPHSHACAQCSAHSLLSALQHCPLEYCKRCAAQGPGGQAAPPAASAHPDRMPATRRHTAGGICCWSLLWLPACYALASHRLPRMAGCTLSVHVHGPLRESCAIVPASHAGTRATA